MKNSFQSSLLVYLACLFLLIGIQGCMGNAGSTGPDVPPVDPAVQELPDRIVWQQPGVVIDALGDLEEKVVADIGAGAGFFAQRLAPFVDRVIAIEIDPHWVDYLNDTVRQMELPQSIRPRLEARLATVDDPHLEEKEVDIVLIVNTFLEIGKQMDYLKRLYPSIKDGGRIVIVDWKKRQMPIGPEQEKRVPLFRLEEMLTEVGFKLVSSDDLTLQYQYIVVATKEEQAN